MRSPNIPPLHPIFGAISLTICRWLIPSLRLTYSNLPYFMLQGKTYRDAAEEKLRKKIFSGHLEVHVIDAHNRLYKAGKKTFTMGVNSLSDMVRHHATFKCYD